MSEQQDESNVNQPLGTDAVTEPNQSDPNKPASSSPEPMASNPVPVTPIDRFQAEIAARKQADLDEHEDETVLWSGGYTPKAMFGAWIGMAAATVALLIAPFLVDGIPWGIIIGVVVGMWIIGSIVYAWRRLGYHYELTTQRFIHQSGILNRQTDRIEVIDIDDVSFRQGPVQRIFGVGNIVLTGSDRSHPTLSMIGIANVREVSGTIDDTRRKERRRRSLHIEAI